MTELDETFAKILIIPYKAWYFGNIKCDLIFLYNSNPNVPWAELNNHLKCMCTNDVFVMKQNIQSLHQHFWGELLI